MCHPVSHTDNKNANKPSCFTIWSQNCDFGDTFNQTVKNMAHSLHRITINFPSLFATTHFSNQYVNYFIGSSLEMKSLSKPLKNHPCKWFVCQMKSDMGFNSLSIPMAEITQGTARKRNENHLEID